MKGSDVGWHLLDVVKMNRDKGVRYSKRVFDGCCRDIEVETRRRKHEGRN